MVNFFDSIFLSRVIQQSRSHDEAHIDPNFFSVLFLVVRVFILIKNQFEKVLFVLFLSDMVLVINLSFCCCCVDSPYTNVSIIPNPFFTALFISI
jgi:hypothetical protein